MISNTPFQYCSRCGSDSLATVSNREFVCSDCGYRHFITPIPSASALILDAKQQLLVIRRAHEPGLGKLGLPGGVIEPGETGEEAAARETMEEVGLTLPVSRFEFLTSLPNLYLFQGFLWPTVDLFYAAHVPDFSSLRATPEEVSEILLMPLHDVPLSDFAFESNANAVRRLQEVQARLG